MISQRPAEVAERVVAGHWEGDLIMGAANRSAIGTLVERTTRYTVLLHLANGHGAGHVRDALVDAVSAMPARVRRSLTWDQGVEMGRHDEFTLATDVPVYEREHEWPAASVLPQGHGSQRPRGRTSGHRGRRSQHAAAQDPGLGDPFLAPR